VSLGKKFPEFFKVCSAFIFSQAIDKEKPHGKKCGVLGSEKSECVASHLEEGVLSISMWPC